MTPTWQSDDGAIQLYRADCRDVLPHVKADCVITDSPYGLSFMGKGWDKGIPGPEFWSLALGCCKPGAHLLAFGGTRTFHRLTCAIEDAGWEIRDCIMWVYGSGFPKSLDASKAIDKAAGAERAIVGSRTNGNRGGGAKTYDDDAYTWPREFHITSAATAAARDWQGWGTALKPAWEPIIVARKPLDGTVAENVLRHGTGAINVDGCRIEAGGDYKDGGPRYTASAMAQMGGHQTRPYVQRLIAAGEPLKDTKAHDLGRWPANLIHDGSDEVTELFPQAANGGRSGESGSGEKLSMFGIGSVRQQTYFDSGSAARFFYCAKASKADRDEGCEGMERKNNMRVNAPRESEETKTNTVRGNHHPTVKPTALMRYLCRLVTPPGGIVLDPFLGSGSTLKAAALEGFGGVGIEIDPAYFEIAVKRIGAALNATPLFDKPKVKQLSMV